MRWLLVLVLLLLAAPHAPGLALPAPAGTDAAPAVPHPPSHPVDALRLAVALSGLDPEAVEALAVPGPVSPDLAGAHGRLLAALGRPTAPLSEAWLGLDPALQAAVAPLLDAAADAVGLASGAVEHLDAADRERLAALHSAYRESRTAADRAPLVAAGAEAGLPPAVDRERIAAAALRLVSAGLDAAPALRAAAPTAAWGGACLIDPSGFVALCGPEDNVIDGDHVLRIDLGGNDVHRGNSGGSGLPLLFPGPNGLPVALALDIAGSDRYSGVSQVQGSGSSSPGVLIDLEGSDTYTATDGFFTFAQGAGHLGGVGVLYDALGNDVYQGGGWDAQGFGIMGGIGVLVDPVGSDVYLGGVFAQGVGDFDAVGLLLDAEGVDLFAASKWSMGFGDGMGLGILWDGTGSDYRQAGSRSQGAGVGGYGVLIDAEGDDVYLGSESQGFAVGGPVLRPLNDVLELLGLDMVGAALLLDGAGNDHYAGAGCNGCTWTGGASGLGQDLG